jgi:hypothetical protein
MTYTPVIMDITINTSTPILSFLTNANAFAEPTHTLLYLMRSEHPI